jgi:membrane fusion protein (multidrug efflux system)
MNALANIAVDDAAALPRRRFAISRKPLAVATIAILIAALGIGWMLMPRTSESTDNAYVRADSTAVAPRVGGLVAEVLVKDNQAVHAGDPLVRIDSEEFDARLASAQAAVADAVAGVATARAALDGLGAEQQLAQARVRAAQTGIQSSDAEYSRAAADQTRFESLAAQGFATRRDAERVRSVAVAAKSGSERSRADRDVFIEQASVTQARGPVLAAELASAQAAEARARAALDLARQDREHTIIRAPVDGVVSNRQAQVGDFVQPGTRLMTLVPTSGIYVVANFKETQTRHMASGQSVTVYVDALGGSVLRGHVESFAPASGSESALLPFEPGSGNFTKIVQRIAVRIAIDSGEPGASSLRSGLSATVKVQL